jgi:hypothetical protein
MWCPNDKQNFIQHTSLGQINENTEVGKLLINITKTEKLNTILDIGTWNGLGSTKCFLLGLKENNTTNFISIESNEEKNKIAKENLSHLLNENCKLYHGSILKKDDVIDIEKIFPIFLSNKEFQRWHNIDMINIEQSPYIFELIPDEIDFVLFDGGEFTSYYEFVKLFPRCTNYIALDDVNVEKCKKIREILKLDTNWKEISYINERNGFSLFKKNIN